MCLTLMPSSVAYSMKLPLSSNTTLGCTASESGLVMSFSTASLQQGSQLDAQDMDQAAAWATTVLRCRHSPATSLGLLRCQICQAAFSQRYASPHKSNTAWGLRPSKQPTLLSADGQHSQAPSNFVVGACPDDHSDTDLLPKSMLSSLNCSVSLRCRSLAASMDSS